LPCFQALRLPFGAPGLVPPCIRHRILPFTAGDRHSCPALVLAPQRGASVDLPHGMGLIGYLFIRSLAPTSRRLLWTRIQLVLSARARLSAVPLIRTSSSIQIWMTPGVQMLRQPRKLPFLCTPECTPNSGDQE
jgi:hypothetical protein